MSVQQRHFTNRTTFDFGPDGLRYTVRDRSGSRTFTVPYLDSPDPETTEELVERNAWLFNVGLLWTLLGGAITVWRITQGDPGGSIWLLVGLGCLAAARLTVTRYTVVRTSGGSVFVIRDKQHDVILETWREHRRTALRERFGEVDFANDPQRELAKFRWLHSQHVLSADELRSIEAKIVSVAQLRADADGQEPAAQN